MKGVDGVPLAAWEFGEGGRGASPGGDRRPSVLLLHGPVGRATAWWRTARWLTPAFRAVALEARADGPVGADGVGGALAAADAEAAIDQLGLGPAVVVGHSLGALTAWRLAARAPEAVRAVVAAEMRCAPLTEDQVAEAAAWLAAWPLPFASFGEAREWFSVHDPSLEDGPSEGRGEFLAELLDRQEDGLRPHFAPERVVAEFAACAHRPFWEELGRVRCPTLVVRGLKGYLGRAEAQEMVRVLPQGSYAEVAGAGHLLHAEQPDAWRRAIEPFIHAVAPTPQATDPPHTAPTPGGVPGR
ncbi:hypothetical protein BIV57_03885, partial [Mangrovactinospora gilvigrisea]